MYDVYMIGTCLDSICGGIIYFRTSKNVYLNNKF